MIYFDNAATSGNKPPSVVKAVNNSLRFLSANPGRSGHYLSQKTAEIIYNSRECVANYFNSDGPETVVFTYNCTQSINFVLKGVLKKGDHIVVSDLEHNAVMRPIISMGIDYSVAEVSFIDDDVTVNNFKDSLKSNTKMIFCTAASNVVGKILPLERIGQLCKENNILFGIDAAQGAGHMLIDMKKMNISYLCVAPHKGLYCPMGFGVLIARDNIEKTVIEGGTGTESINFKQPQTMPEKLESGTLNLPSICSIKEGINYVNQKKEIISNYDYFLISHFYNLMIDDVIFYAKPLKDSFVPVLSFNIKGYNSEDVASFLNKKGFALRAGLQCAPLAHKKIGTLSSGTVRFSPSIFNKIQEVESLAYNLKKFIKIKK